ncbi:MAG: 30S ribosomal protein S17e [Nitrososphaeraceae archaeon]|nr:30S ribosomal protein S17e [Nitrososphaeraceae archaeon]
MNRIKRLSNELLSKYPNQFTINFDENKKMISDIATVRSKILRNKVAGYITSKLRKESDKEKNQQTDNQTDDELN